MELHDPPRTRAAFWEGSGEERSYCGPVDTVSGWTAFDVYPSGCALFDYHVQGRLDCDGFRVGILVMVAFIPAVASESNIRKHWGVTLASSCFCLKRCFCRLRSQSSSCFSGRGSCGVQHVGQPQAARLPWEPFEARNGGAQENGEPPNTTARSRVAPLRWRGAANRDGCGESLNVTWATWCHARSRTALWVVDSDEGLGRKRALWWSDVAP